ncbi:hypothetical protein MK852_24285 [Shewanella benthica]|uniref:hypothetical protein n=1 Tax=Shewanella benthica TaxID=43661 RepID=UPI00187A2D59|nr:hypothetical protein [Shewanella benthica]MBE7216824.1 hypothetical protein [Shewanella benthica]MCL1065201.1 hypothetical protein [Shewanella benthica]
MNRIGTNKSILIFVSILGLTSSIYGYYELMSIVPAFADIFGAFETNLTTATQFIIQTHSYYGLLSVIGFLTLALTLFDKISLPKAYILVASNLLFMLGVRWLTANELNQSILTMGIIQ